MTLELIPDAEKIVRDYLVAHADVAALDVHILGQSPDNRDHAWIKLTQLDARNLTRSRARRLFRYLLQLDCYASKAGTDGSQQRQASAIARTVEAALAALPDATLDDVVITDSAVTSMPRLPDTTMEPARERFSITVAVLMHPRS